MKCWQSMWIGLVVCTATAFGQTNATNVILFIGDGMGPEQVCAASYYASGSADGLVMHSLPHHATAKTHSADNAVTDSAASGTAMATGNKVNNGVIGLALPGDGQPLPTILEHFQRRGALTGLVTTDSLLGATPSAFAAHQPKRNMARPIAADILRTTRPNVLLGGGGPGLEDAASAGYTVVHDRAGFEKLAKTKNAAPHLAGIFGGERFQYYHTHPEAYKTTYPRLHEMTAVAIEVLSRSEKGFFLMVESALIDKSGHNHRVKDDAQRSRCNITETLEMDKAVRVALDFAEDHPDTLIIVTADHECGGLKLLQSAGKGQWPDTRWSTNGHTAKPVPVFAIGPGSERFTGQVDNTDIFEIMLESVELKTPEPAGAE